MQGFIDSYLWGGELKQQKKAGQIRPVFFQPIGVNMNSTVKSYLYFLGFLAITKMVVKPIAVQMKIPVISELI